MSKTMMVCLIILGLAFGASAYIIIATINNQRNDVFSNMDEVTSVNYSYGDIENKKVKKKLANKLYEADKYAFEENTQKGLNLETELSSRPNFVFYGNNKKELYNIYIKDQRSTMTITLVKEKDNTEEYIVKDSELIDYIRQILMEL